VQRRIVRLFITPYGLPNPLASSRSDNFETRSSRSGSSSRSPVYLE
jgi:hypothetical protein